MAASGRVVIIGGGLVGCATAFELASVGVPVTVLERGSVNQGASSRNAGSLHFQIEPRMVDALRKDPALLASLVPISRAAIQDWAGLETRLGAKLEVATHGGIVVGETEADYATLSAKIATENSAGLDTCMLEGAELHAKCPALNKRIQFGAWCADEGYANSRLVTPAYARAAMRAGANIRSGEEVTAITPTGSGFDVITRLGRHHAAQLLIAAGAWSAPIFGLMGLRLPLRPIGLNMNLTERARPHLHVTIQHVGRRLSLKQLDAGNYVIGGSWPAALDPGAGDCWPDQAKSDPLAILGSLQVASDVVPAVKSLHLLRAWTGIASDTPDHLPVLGPVDAIPGLFVAAGGSSFTLGPTYARFMAAIMRGEDPGVALDAYRPDRLLGRLHHEG